MVEPSKTGDSKRAREIEKFRVAFLEVLPSVRERNYRSEYFPFIAGWLDLQEIEHTWLCVGVEAIPSSSGRNQYVYGFPREDVEKTVRRLEEFAPTHVLLNERLEDELWEHLRARLPDTSFAMAGFWHSEKALEVLETWLGLDTSQLRATGLLFEEQVTPCFSKHPVNELATTIRPLVLLLVGAECAFSAPLRSNPYFREADLSSCAREVGCSFCIRPAPRHFLPACSPVDLAVRQIRAFEETGTRAVNGREFRIRGVSVLPRIESLFAEMAAIELPPSDFHFSCRIDELVACERALRNILPDLERSGHRLVIWNIGIENFSEVENARLNKGLSRQVIADCIELTRDLRKKHPDAFQFDPERGFGFILFTPWTTLADLQINHESIIQFGLRARGFLFGSALQLVPGMPITRLAEEHGLLVETPADARSDSGCISSFDEVEIPWMFENSSVSRVFFIARRLTHSDIVPRDDPAFVLIQRWLDGMSCDDERLSDVFGALLAVFAGEADGITLLGVLRRVEASLNHESGLALHRFVEVGGAWLDGVDTAVEAFSRDAPGADDWAKLAESVKAAIEHNSKIRAALWDYEVVSVAAQQGRGTALELVVLHGGSEVRLLIEARRKDSKFLCSEGALALSYTHATEPLTGQDRALFRRLLHVVSVFHRNQFGLVD